MKKNPVIAYGIIAVIGIALMLVLSFVGLNQMDEKQAQGEKKTTEQAGGGEEAATTDPEAIVKSTCSMCHGADLSGGAGPNLQKIGSKYDQAKIENIIMNGTNGGMPGNLVSKEQAAALAEWLAKKK